MKLNPSMAHVWLPCPGSVRMMEGMAQEERSETAKEGIVAHELAAMVLRGQECAPIQDDEMADAVELYVNHVQSITARPHVEEYLHCPGIHPNCGGSPDAWFFDSDLGQVHVWDFKYGHRYVEVEGNPQLACYAAGIVDRVEGQKVAVNGVHFHIVQPRAYGSEPIRTWSFGRGGTEDARYVDLYDALRESANEAVSDAPSLNPGGHCGDCSARRKCPALQESAYNIVAISDTLFERDLTVEQSARELTLLTKAAELVQARIDSLKPVVENAVRGGASGLGWVVEQARSSLVWDRPISEVILLGQVLGVKLDKEKVVTPLQAIKAGLTQDIVGAYAKTVPGNSSLKPFTPIKEFR